MESVNEGEAELRAERLLLESEYEACRAAAAVVSGEVESLRGDSGAAVRDRNEGKERLREAQGALEAAEKEMVVWKQRAHRMQANEGKLEKLDRIIAAAAHYAERIRSNDALMLQYEAETAAILQQQAAREEKERELQAVRTRCRQLERDGKEAGRYKQQCKLLEKEAMEAGRWKLAVKQGKLRERTLETQLKELQHWRQRARAFEKEVKLLRAWRRQLCEQAIRDGKEALIPEFPLEVSPAQD